MNELRWTDTNPAVEIDRLLITLRGLVGLAIVVAVLIPGLGILIAAIILSVAYARYRWRLG